jgi:hypothetical protein
LRLFADWRAAFPLYLQLSDLRWDAKAQLFCKAGFPEVDIRLPDDRTFYAVTEEEIATGPALSGMTKVRTMARADSPAVTQSWAEMGEKVGYSCAVEAENQAAVQRSALARSLLSMPAQSAAGAAAKLNCFIEMNTPVAHCRKHLHPELRRLIEPSFPDLQAIPSDLVSIGGSSDGLFRA